MMGVSFIIHNGKKILLLDLSGSKNIKESIDVLEQARKLIIIQPLRSILLFTDVTDANYNIEAVEVLKQVSKDITPHLKASAAIGVTGLKKISAQALIALTGRKIGLFDTADQAKDWLVQHE